MAKKHGKRYRALAEQLGERRVMPVDEAVGLVKSTANAKFDETVDVTVVLGIDPKKRRPAGARHFDTAARHG